MALLVAIDEAFVRSKGDVAFNYTCALEDGGHVGFFAVFGELEIGATVPMARLLILLAVSEHDSSLSFREPGNTPLKRQG